MSTLAYISIKALQDIVVNQRESWTLSWTFNDVNNTPLDLSGYIFRVVVRDQLGFAWVDQSTTVSSGGTVTIVVPGAKAVMPAGVFNYELTATPPTSTARSWGYGRMLVQKSQA
jgi:hypothetical protein